MIRPNTWTMGSAHSSPRGATSQLTPTEPTASGWLAVTIALASRRTRRKSFATAVVERLRQRRRLRTPTDGYGYRYSYRNAFAYAHLHSGGQSGAVDAGSAGSD